MSNLLRYDIIFKYYFMFLPRMFFQFFSLSVFLANQQLGKIEKKTQTIIRLRKLDKTQKKNHEIQINELDMVHCFASRRPV